MSRLKYTLFISRRSLGLALTVIMLYLTSVTCELTKDSTDINYVSCQDYLSDSIVKNAIESKSRISTPCPCTEQIIAEDYTFRRNGRCYQEWIYHEGVKQMCCYGSDGELQTGPDVGGYIESETTPYNMSDVHRRCCQTSMDLCAAFYQSNPSDNCSRYEPPVTVKSYGDPTITTLDGVSYGFNGHGEYVFLKTKDIEIQTRTGYITEGNIDATAFTAFALFDKNSGSNVELLFNQTSKSIEIYRNGKHLTCNLSAHRPRACEPPNNRCFVVAGVNTIIPNGCSINTLAKSIKFTVGETMDIKIEILKANAPNMTGLASVTKDDYFISRNGSKTSTNASESAKFDYGETWALTNSSESIFNYNISGHDFSFYNSNHTRPHFLEDLVGNITALFEGYSAGNITKFNETCRTYWDHQPNIQCLLAIARSHDYNQGVAVMKQANKTRNLWELNHNTQPYFTSNITENSVITVIPHGIETSFSINLLEYAFDNDSNSQLRFRVDTGIPSTDYTLENGIFIWNFTDSLRNVTLTALNFYVFDKFNKSSSHQMSIRYCGCEHGVQECENFPNITSDISTTGQVITATCNCDKRHTGTYCEETVDPCSLEKCHNGCNSSAVGENPCLPCKRGFHGDGRVCTDINECEGYEGEDKCEQHCNNSIGTFTCSCDHGYVLDKDNHTCNDIDECSAGTVKCSHHAFCYNTPGSHDCVCMPGYMKKEDNGSCEVTEGAMYVGSVTFELTITKSTENINETVDTATNRQTMTAKLDERFKKAGTKGYVSVEVYRLSIIITTAKTGRKKREASKSGLLNVDYIVNWASVVNDTETVLDSLAEAVAGYTTDKTKSELEDVGSIFLSSLHVKNGTDASVCSVPGKTDCNKLSTHCLEQDGGFSCGCNPGFKEDDLSNKYCTDINECVDDPDIRGKCFQGVCKNQVGSWNCSCPRDRTWQNVGNSTSPAYRCQGNYSYIGSTSLLWADGNSTENIRTIIESELTNLFRNESNESGSYGDPISNLMVSATVLKLNQTESFENGSVAVTAIYNIQMGEVVSVDRVANVLKNIAPRTRQNPNSTFLSFHIYKDKENRLCELTNNGGCEPDSSVCEQRNGTTTCTCRGGYKKQTASAKFCTDLNECEAGEGHCIGGFCGNRVGSWFCTCNTTNYKPVQKSTDTYRCMGDFQYVGAITLVSLQEMNNTQITSLFDNSKISPKLKRFDKNITLAQSNEFIPMSELFMNIEVVSINKSVDGVSFTASVTLIIHIGDPVKFDDVNSTFGAITIVDDSPSIRSTNYMIFKDDEYNLCDIKDRTTCDLDTTHCNVSRGSYSCPCKEGYETTGNPNSCSNINECTDKMVTCDGGGACVDTVGNWTCTCNDTTEFHRHNDTYGICEDKDECKYDSEYLCLGGNCSNTNNGWDCICSHGYQADMIRKDVFSCNDIDECKNSVHVCSNDGACKNTNGNWTCLCPSGYQATYINETFIECSDIDECHDPLYTCDGPTKESATCTNTPGSWECSCGNGFKVDKNETNVKSCSDIDECAHTPTRCQNGGTCVNTDGSFSCNCPSGYNVTKSYGNDYNYTCIDINECSLYGKEHACIRALTCDNLPGDWDCVCSDGLNAMVVNSTSKICGGGYQYVATISFTLYNKVNSTVIFRNYLEKKIQDLYIHAYTGQKVWIELLTITGLMNVDNGVAGRTVSAKYIVQTVEKMNITQLYHIQDIYKEQKCTKGPCDLDEIGTNPITYKEIDVLNNSAICDTPRNICNLKESNCVSNDGQLDCQCKDGYIKASTNGFQCLDIDECTEPTYSCNNGTCQNTKGGWDCTCIAGYRVVMDASGTNITCEDIDECSDNEHTCTNGGSCVNSDGSWSCDCPKGFEIGRKNITVIGCEDMDECTSKEYSCEGPGNSSTCTNTIGNWSCDCKTGYKPESVSDVLKHCKGGDFTYSFSMSLTIDGSISHESLKISLQKQLEDIYAKALNDLTVWIEILSIEDPSARRQKRDNGNKYVVQYVIHTEQKTDMNQISEALNKTKSFNNLTIANQTVKVEDISRGNNADLCTMCEAATTTCHSSDNKFSCDCKPGYMKLKDDLYKCIDIDECATKSVCWNGSICTNIPGSYNCSCKPRLRLHESTKGGEKVCAEPCSFSKCHKTSVCTNDNNKDGYICGCELGRTGPYCQNTEDTGTSDKTILIAIGSTLGAIVIVLSIVVFVVCRWRAARIKEAEKMAMKYMDDSGVRGFDNEYLTDQYMRKQENGSEFSHRVSNGTFHRGTGEDIRGLSFNSEGVHTTNRNPNIILKAPHRSSLPNLGNGYSMRDRNDRQQHSIDHGEFSSLERGRYGNGVSYPQYQNRYLGNNGKGRRSPEPDYEPQRSPRPDYRNGVTDASYDSRDSGVGNGFQSSGNYIDEDIVKNKRTAHAANRTEPARNSTRF